MAVWLLNPCFELLHHTVLVIIPLGEFLWPYNPVLQRSQVSLWEYKGIAQDTEPVTGWPGILIQTYTTPKFMSFTFLSNLYTLNTGTISSILTEESERLKASFLQECRRGSWRRVAGERQEQAELSYVISPYLKMHRCVCACVIEFCEYKSNMCTM